MLNPVPQKLNRNNLITASKALDGLKYFAFYGTILGLTRNADIIEDDDDIDLLVNIHERDEVIKRFNSSIFDLDLSKPVNQTYFFLQATLVQEGITTYIDIYFYEDKDGLDYIIDRWSFLARWHEPKSALHIPKELIFPLKKENFFGIDIQVPNNKSSACEFLYGTDWKTPKSKKTDYSMGITDNKPIMNKKINVVLSKASPETRKMINQLQSMDKEIQALTMQIKKSQEERAKLNGLLISRLEKERVEE